MPENIEAAPKIIGLKNIKRVKLTVVFIFSPENPGATQETTVGAKIKRITPKAVKKIKKTFRVLLAKRQASRSARL